MPHHAIHSCVCAHLLFVCLQPLAQQPPIIVSPKAAAVTLLTSQHKQPSATGCRPDVGKRIPNVKMHPGTQLLVMHTCAWCGAQGLGRCVGICL